MKKVVIGFWVVFLVHMAFGAETNTDTIVFTIANDATTQEILTKKTVNIRDAGDAQLGTEVDTATRLWISEADDPMYQVQIDQTRYIRHLDGTVNTNTGSFPLMVIPEFGEEGVVALMNMDGTADISIHVVIHENEDGARVATYWLKTPYADDTFHQRTNSMLLPEAKFRIKL